MVHEILLVKQRMVEVLSESTSESESSNNALIKATTMFKKSAIAFEKAVDGAKSLGGTGSGKVPLLLLSSCGIAVPDEGY